MSGVATCQLPPEGWLCNLPAGHGGPCPTWRDYRATGKPAGWLERWVGNMTGEILVWLGKRAWDRGDVHEFEHLRRALIWGNSNHENPKWPCPFLR